MGRLRNRFQRRREGDTGTSPGVWLLLFQMVQKLLPLLLAGGVGAATVAVALIPAKPETPEIPVTIQEPTSTPPGLVASGWIADPDAVDAVLGEMETPYFRDTPAGQAKLAADPEQVFLWQAVEKVTGSPSRVMNQNPVGSCVAFGTARAAEKSLAVQITQGDRFKFEYMSEEVIYAGSRVEIGGGRIRGDGSVGAWAARFGKEYGFLPKGIWEADGKTWDLTKYEPTRCRQWGSSGVPDQLEPQVREFPVKDTAMVTSWADARKALAQGYGIAICSNQGFTMRRDANGVCRPSGTWMHCMSLDGYALINGREHGHIENSWGPNAHTGPVGPGNPNGAGFWADAQVIDRMLRQRDSWAFSAVKGFPSRKIDWFAIHKPDRVDPRRRLRVAPPEFALAW